MRLQPHLHMPHNFLLNKSRNQNLHIEGHPHWLTSNELINSASRLFRAGCKKLQPERTMSIKIQMISNKSQWCVINYVSNAKGDLILSTILDLKKRPAALNLCTIINNPIEQSTGMVRYNLIVRVRSIFFFFLPFIY